MQLLNILMNKLEKEVLCCELENWNNIIMGQYMRVKWPQESQIYCAFWQGTQCYYAFFHLVYLFHIILGINVWWVINQQVSIRIYIRTVLFIPSKFFFNLENKDAFVCIVGQAMNMNDILYRRLHTILFSAFNPPCGTTAIWPVPRFDLQINFMITNQVHFSSCVYVFSVSL